MNANNLLRGLLAILLVTFTGLIYFSLRDTSAQEGKAAPVFTLKTDQQRTITPTAFGGKVLVLNFWATWCAPCITEIPSLNQFQRKFAQEGVVVVAVSIDKKSDKYQVVPEEDSGGPSKPIAIQTLTSVQSMELTSFPKHT